MSNDPVLAASRTRKRALIALLLTVPAPSIGVIAAMILWPKESFGLIGPVIFGVCKAWMLLVPVAWRLLIDRAPLSLSPARQGGFGVAAMSGMAIAAVILGAGFLLGPSLIDFDHARHMAEQNGIGTIEAYLAGIAYWVLVNSVLEEYVYRWFIFEKCEQLAPSWAAVVLSALFFTIHHVIALRVQFDWPATVLGSLGVFIGGAVWSWLYRRYRSIWPGYLSHAIADIAVFTLGWWIIFGA